ncbi:MAG: hypothetical protein AAF597_21115, partial [Bacteroidota bacterium]
IFRYPNHEATERFFIENQVKLSYCAKSFFARPQVPCWFPRPAMVLNPAPATAPPNLCHNR